MSYVLWRPDSCSVNLLDCNNHPPPLINESFYTNLQDNLISCSQSVGNLTYPEFDVIQHSNVTLMDHGLNGSFCGLEFQPAKDSIDNIDCLIDDGFYGLATCFSSYGNSMLTFLLFILVKSINQVAQSNCYFLIDGKNMEAVAMHNGDYPTVMLFESLACAIAPVIGGYLVIDSSDPYSKVNELHGLKFIDR